MEQHYGVEIEMDGAPCLIQPGWSTLPHSTRMEHPASFNPDGAPCPIQPGWSTLPHSTRMEQHYGVEIEMDGAPCLIQPGWSSIMGLKLKWMEHPFL